MTEMTLTGPAADFTRTHPIAGDPAALRAAITTAAGVSGWWAPTTSPRPDLLRVSFGETGVELRVVEAPDRIVWDVVSCSAMEDWVGTSIEFVTTTGPDGNLELGFTHKGLAALPCAEQCFAGWSHYLPSLVAFVEHGAGNPGPRQS